MQAHEYSIRKQIEGEFEVLFAFPLLTTFFGGVL